MDYIYKAYTLCSTEITKHELVKETPKQVVYVGAPWGGRRREIRSAKKGSYENFFKTWQEAHDFLLRKAEASVEGARRNLESAKDKLGNVKEMKNTVDD